MEDGFIAMIFIIGAKQGPDAVLEYEKSELHGYKWDIYAICEGKSDGRDRKDKEVGRMSWQKIEERDYVCSPKANSFRGGFKATGAFWKKVC